MARLTSKILTSQGSTTTVDIGVSEDNDQRCLILTGTWTGTFKFQAKDPQTGNFEDLQKLSFTVSGAYPVQIPYGTTVRADFSHSSGSLTATLVGG